jgi:hypothetical protein
MFPVEYPMRPTAGGDTRSPGGVSPAARRVSGGRGMGAASCGALRRQGVRSRAGSPPGMGPPCSLGRRSHRPSRHETANLATAGGSAPAIRRGYTPGYHVGDGSARGASTVRGPDARCGGGGAGGGARRGSRAVSADRSGQTLSVLPCRPGSHVRGSGATRRLP